MAFKVVRDEKGTATRADGTKAECLITGVYGPDGKNFGPRKKVFTSGMAEEV